MVQDMVAERGPVVRGSFHVHGTTCGKDNCKCARGELHTTAVLAVSEQGRQRNIYVRPPDRLDLKKRAESYRRYRKRRAGLSKVHSEIRALADELLAALLIPYEPERTDRSSGRGGRRRTPGTG